MRATGWLMGLAALLLVGCAGPERARTYQEAYNLPLISPGAKFVNLPPAVQHTLQAQTGAAEIADITQSTQSGRTVYRISFVKHGVLPPLYVAQDGSILNPDLTLALNAPEELSTQPGAATGRLTLDDLPAKVRTVLEERAPDAEVATIDKVPYGNQPVYIITFRDPSHPKLYISPDGTILGEGPK